MYRTNVTLTRSSPRSSCTKSRWTSRMSVGCGDRVGGGQRDGAGYGGGRGGRGRGRGGLVRAAVARGQGVVACQGVLLGQGRAGDQLAHDRPGSQVRVAQAQYLSGRQIRYAETDSVVGDV